MNIHNPPKGRQGTFPAQSLNAARAHIKALRDNGAAVMDFRLIPETDAAKEAWAEDDHRTRLRFRGTIADLFDKLKARNDKGFAVYYVLNLTDGKGTKKENFKRVVALPLDLDGAPLPKKWPGGLLPHLTIESSPGKYQCLFMIEPTTDFAATKRMVQRLAHKHGGDPSVCDVPRVLRLAGFKHQKGKPFISRIIDSNPFDAPHTLAQFDAVLPQIPESGSKSDGVPGGVGSVDLESAKLLLDELDPADVIPDNDKWEELAMSLHSACDNDPDVKTHFLEWCAQDGTYDEAHADNNEYRWESFTADKEGGRGAGTLRKFLRDAGVSDSKLKAVFDAPNVAPEDDFDEVDDDDDDDWLGEKPAKPKKAKIHRTAGGVGYQIASEVMPEEIQWIWKNRIARGKLNFLAGPADQGKSQITCDLVARVTNGTAWPNHEGTITKADHGSVIMLSAEDDAADTLVPRLKAAGADMDKVFIVSMMVRPLQGKAERMFNLGEDIAKLTEIIQAKPDHTFKLITIDPINSYMGGGGRNSPDTWKTSDVRAVLSPLGDWSAKHDIATLFLSHLAKGSGKNASPLHRMLDSQAFTAIARCGWFVAPEMKDKAETGTKFFVKGKANVGAPMPGLTYEIEAVKVTHKGVTLPQVPRIKWTGTTDKSSGQAFQQMDSGGETTERKPTLAEAAATFLRDELSGGPLTLDAVKALALEQGHDWRNVRRAATEIIGVDSTSEGFGKDKVTSWSIPEPNDGFG